MDPQGELSAGLDGDVQSPTHFHELLNGKLDTAMRLDSSAADAVMLLPDKKVARQVLELLLGS